MSCNIRYRIREYLPQIDDWNLSDKGHLDHFTKDSAVNLIGIFRTEYPYRRFKLVRVEEIETDEKE